METPVILNLVSFLELADSNMHQFVQQHGMQALQKNPEMMGTSVGMLRRVSLIMLHMARHEACRSRFSKLQNRLLQFTVSHFMDSRVAAMVADILYELLALQQPSSSSRSNAESQQGSSSPIVDADEQIRSSSVMDSSFQPNNATKFMSETEGTAPSSLLPVNGVHYGDLNGGSHMQHAKSRKRRATPEIPVHPNGNGNSYSEENDSEQKCSRKLLTTSEAVKEKLRNNILKHEEEAARHELDSDMPPHDLKRPKHEHSLLNGARINGTSGSSHKHSDEPINNGTSGTSATENGTAWAIGAHH